jgi:hypothetical protein
MDSLFIYLFLFGGFALSLVVGISYFCSRRLSQIVKIGLGIAALGPLISLALLFGGLFASGRQVLALLPCLIAGLIFVAFQLIESSSKKKPISIAPCRAIAGFAAIGWSGIIATNSAHYCFMGACC